MSPELPPALCHRTTWRPCWSPGAAPAPLPTARLGRAATQPAPVGTGALRLGHSHPPGWAGPRGPAPGPPHSGVGSSSGWAASVTTSLRHTVPQGPGHLLNPSLCPLSQGVYSFWVICLCLRKRGLSKNLRTASNKPFRLVQETVPEARQNRRLDSQPLGPRCSPPCTLRSGRQAGTLGPAAGWGTHTLAPGPGGRPGALGLGAGPGRGFRAGEFLGSFFFLRRQGSPGADVSRTGRETDRQWVLRLRRPPVPPAPLPSAPRRTAAAAASPALSWAPGGVRRPCLCPERGS